MPSVMLEGYPLSFQQKRLWSFRLPGRETELVARAEYAINGDVDQSALEQALVRVIQRHEICRSVYKTVPALPEPLQSVKEDFSLTPPAGPGRLEETPTFDWALERVGEQDFRLSVCFPAVAADRTSLCLFLEEFARQFAHLRQGTIDTSEPMQYLDYAQWQLDLRESPEAKAKQEFWRRLEAVQAAPRLPLEVETTEFAPKCKTIGLDRTVLAFLDGLASRANATREVAFLALWVAFCARLLDLSSSLKIGVYSPGRNFEELSQALGPYDRYLPIRAELSNQSSLSTLLSTIQILLHEARRNQDYYPVAAVNDPGPAGLLFAYHSGTVSRLVDRTRLLLENAVYHSEPFQLELEVLDGDSTTLRLWHNLKAVSESYASLIADRFVAYSAELARQKDAQPASLPFISAQERQRLLTEFARTVTAEPAAPTVLDLFESGLRQHPERPALICDGKRLSYAELNEQSNALAMDLRGLGLTSGTPVAICAQRSFEMIVGLLGILKAGGAYVPLDPSYPKDRLKYILEDCGASILVTQTNLLDTLPPHTCQVLTLSLSQRREANAHSDARLDANATAYIIYTSGSTGQPKGVPITHRNLAYSTAARLSYYRRPIANFLLLSSFAFDSSIAGIFWTLSQGGTLTIPEEGTHQDPKELAGLIQSFGISHLLALPSFYAAILEHSPTTYLASLSTVIVAGEACRPELVQQHFTKLPNAELYNEYGPTEGTVWSTVHRCEAVLDSNQIPIGRPVPNMSVYILDADREPVGVGQIGEIYISGPSVAKGYLNHDALTAERFSVNLADSNSPYMLYRTGDLGRFRMDGSIEFHGRIDEQVKIRGYRVEIGEIESVLSRHPAVRDAVVAALDEEGGQKRLVAYVVAKERTPLSIPDLLSFARQALPPFMLPAQFFLMPRLPLTPNGKINRKALPAPEELHSNDRNCLAPRNTEEELLAGIWKELLKLEKIGIEENFFDLGGHSLLAIQVIARVREAFRVELPLAAFFNAPTIAGISDALVRCRQSTAASSGGIRRIRRMAAGDEVLAKLNGTPHSGGQF